MTVESVFNISHVNALLDLNSLKTSHTPQNGFNGEPSRNLSTEYNYVGFIIYSNPRT